MENLPKNGGYILAMNHVSYLDFFLTFAYFKVTHKRNIYFLAKASINYNFVWNMFLRYSNAILVDYDNFSSIKTVYLTIIELLKQNEIVGIFPEGTRSETGKLLEAKSGIGHIINRHKNVPLIPVGLNGFYEAWPRHHKVMGISRCDITIGHPIDIKSDESGKSQDVKKVLTTKLMKEIAVLTNQDYNY